MENPRFFILRRPKSVAALACAAAQGGTASAQVSFATPIAGECGKTKGPLGKQNSGKSHLARARAVAKASLSHRVGRVRTTSSTVAL